MVVVGVLKKRLAQVFGLVSARKSLLVFLLRGVFQQARCPHLSRV
jgi:hypothetical protein